MGNWVSTECDPSTGLITKTRGIEKPSLNGGATCGPSQTKEPCKVDCVMNEWSMPGECNINFRTRTRTIKYEPRHGGATCGPTTITIPCNKVDCKMSQWTDGACDSLTGLKMRTRTIETQPFDGGLPCGTTITYEPCANCKLSQWTNWSDCNSTTGLRKRTRTIETQPFNGGKICEETEQIEKCAVNCKMSQWSDWSNCDPNIGNKGRSRYIEIHPLNGGLECGELFQIEDCLVSSTGLIQLWSGIGIVPDFDFSIMKIEIIGGGGAGGYGSYIYGPPYQGGGGGGAGEYKVIEIHNDNLNDKIFWDTEPFTLKGLRYTWNLGTGGRTFYNDGGDTIFNLNNKTYIARGGKNGGDVFLSDGKGGLGAIGEDGGISGNNGFDGSSGSNFAEGGKGADSPYGTGGICSLDSTIANGKGAGSGGAGVGYILNNGEIAESSFGDGAPGGIIISYIK
jgi:hypothetical protein